MKLFEPYVQELEAFVSKFAKFDSTSDRDFSIISHALNGQPSKILRDLVPINELRQTGVFFTGRHLADRLANLITYEIEQGATIYDPTCGVGDLLLACARLLPIGQDLESTIESWGLRLRGSDIYPQFINATKIRLILLAIERGLEIKAYLPILERLFLDIKVCDTFLSNDMSFEKDCIVLNPPYSMVQAPERCEWASGIVSQAALFLEKYVKSTLPGTKIIAILPDVLRTGSRYVKWRKVIEDYVKIESIEILGCFDALTDVDIFICKLIVEPDNVREDASWWTSKRTRDRSLQRVNDYFDVRVGPVVPHRHLLEGPLYPYIHAHQLPSWKSIEVTSEFRNFSGTTFRPPFVVVRRTSRPGDKYRAVGTIITGEEPVAVENHLLVLKPKSDLLNDCFRLLENLQFAKTNEWLNERIRCRHLTVVALRDLPWWEENEF